MFTYKFVVRQGKERYPRVRITYQRKKAELSLKIELDPEDFYDALSKRPKPENMRWCRLLKFYRSKIDDVKIFLIEHQVRITSVAQIRDYVYQAIFPNSVKANLMTNSFEALQNSFRPIIATNSVAPIVVNTPIAAAVRPKFAAYLYDMLLNAKSRSSQKSYRTTYNHLKAFDKDFELREFEDITVDYLRRFDKYLSASTTINGRSCYLRKIRAVLNMARQNNHTSNYPFAQFKIKVKETIKRSLPLDALRKLFTQEPPRGCELGADLFKLIFMFIGINFRDLLNCGKVTQEGRIEYYRAKTGKLYSIKVEPEAMEIIRKYEGESHLLKFCEQVKYTEHLLAEVNKQLHTIGGADYPGLTTYWARHSWATLAAELDFSDSVISQALGHSTAQKVTEVYIMRNRTKVDKANRQILNLVLGGSED